MRLYDQFIASRTNKRSDEWGGSFKNRSRIATEVVRRTRAAAGDDFVLMFRLSMLDLVEGGSSWEEVVELAKVRFTLHNLPTDARESLPSRILQACCQHPCHPPLH